MRNLFSPLSVICLFVSALLLCASGRWISTETKAILSIGSGEDASSQTQSRFPVKAYKTPPEEEFDAQTAVDRKVIGGLGLLFLIVAAVGVVLGPKPKPTP